VSGARRAATAWRLVAVTERQRALRMLAGAIEADSDRLARLLTAEQGKPLAEAQGEVAASAALLRWCGDWVPAQEDALFRESGVDFERRYTSLGVVAGIVPWNYPLLIAIMKLGPALLTGNTIVLKPAPTTPLVTAAVARTAAGLLPPGVLQLLLDDGSVGPRLVRHPGVDKVCFTGSTPTGRDVMAGSATTLKRIALELGGNDPAVVLEDCDVDTVAAGLHAGAFVNAGQVCGAVKRVYAHVRVFGALCEALAARIRDTSIGPGITPGVQMGPLQNATQFRKALTLREDARRRGCMVATAAAPPDRGYFVAPALFTGLSDDDRLVAEEQFCPLLPILSFSDEREAVARANSTPFGLTTSVWSSNADRARRIAIELDAGLVCINKHNDSPFDGAIVPAKASGMGWMFGAEGLKEYLQPHYLTW